MLCRASLLSRNSSFRLHFLVIRPYSLHDVVPFSSKRTTQTPKAPKPGHSLAISLSSDAHAISSLLINTDIKASNFDDLRTGYAELLTGYAEKLKSSELVLEILRNYHVLGRVRTLEFFVWVGCRKNFELDDCLVEYMVDFLGRRKLFDDMRCLLSAILSQGGRISCRAIGICIRFLGRNGRIREALSLFEEMGLRFSFKPDNLVYNNILYVLCKKGSDEEFIDVAVSMFRNIDQPDTYSYSNVIAGLWKHGRFETALEVFDEMIKSNLVPTRSAANVLISELCVMSAKEGAVEKVRVTDIHRPFTILVPNVRARSGAIQPAVNVFWSVYNTGLLPSTYVINRLTFELCRLGEVDKAMKILSTVERIKPRCIEEGYSYVIQALCEQRVVGEVSRLFQRMLSQGIKLKLITYNSILCMLCSQDSIADAENVFEVMKKKSCSPDNVTYTALIHAYGRAKRWEPAYHLVMEMLGLGIFPDSNTFSAVNNLLRENGRRDLCLKMEIKMEAEVVCKYCKAKNLEAAYEKMLELVQKGFCLPVYVRNAFEHAFEKHGRLKRAQELLQKIDEVCTNKKVPH